MSLSLLRRPIKSNFQQAFEALEALICAQHPKRSLEEVAADWGATEDQRRSIWRAQGASERVAEGWGGPQGELMAYDDAVVALMRLPSVVVRFVEWRLRREQRDLYLPAIRE